MVYYIFAKARRRFCYGLNVSIWVGLGLDISCYNYDLFCPYIFNMEIVH